MAIITKHKQVTLRNVVDELRVIKSQLNKLLLLIPEESVKEYKDEKHIMKALDKSLS